MKSLMTLTAIAVPLSFAITPIVAAQQTTTQEQVVAYRCTEGKILEVRYSGKQAIVALETDTLTMTPNASGTGTQYTDVEKQAVLVIDGKNARLVKNGELMFDQCVAVEEAVTAPVPSPGAGTTTEPGGTTTETTSPNIIPQTW